MSDVTPAVRCHGLTYAFGTHRAVDDVDLDVRPGEMFGLLGPERRRQDHDDPHADDAAARGAGTWRRSSAATWHASG